MLNGTVVWDAKKSLWFWAFAALALAGTWGSVNVRNVSLFAVVTAVTLCCGHSVGLHRLMIHRSFKAPAWLEYTLVTLGVLVGMGGPLAMIRLHNERDEQQNLAACHDYFAHRQSLLKDFWWQVHCRFVPATPWEPSARNKATTVTYYLWLEKYWRAVHVTLALSVWLALGFDVMAWTIALRIVVSITGHWFVGHWAHRAGEQRFINRGSAVQGFNEPLLGAISWGEGWHNNHHTFPRSAVMGLRAGQLDVGYAFILLLKKLGLAREVLTPNNRAARFPRATRIRVVTSAPRKIAQLENLPTSH